jgi:modulator of FtsH protease
VTAYSPEAWDSFFVAGAGASAALAGLLFVGISISLPTITSSSRLVRRSLEAFVLLVEVLLVSVLALVPDVDRTALGLGLLGIAAVGWGLVSAVHARTLRAQHDAGDADAPRFSAPAQVLLGQAATVPFVVGAVALIAESGGGLYWFAPGVLLAFVAALVDAWVLLIEIQR